MVNARRTPRRHVGQLIETLDMGGAERLAVQIANARAAAGDNSYLFVLTGPGELSSRISPDVRVRYLEMSRASIDNPFAFARSVWRGYHLLRGHVAREGIDILQTHLPGANFWGLLLAWRNDCVVVPTVHNTREARYTETSETPKRRLRRWAYRQLLKRCSVVVAVSGEVRQSLIEFTRAPGLGRIVVISNGVDIPERLDPALLVAARARYGLPAEDPFVLAAGRLTEQKNFPGLLDAVLILRRRGVRLRVMIAGEGPLRAYLEQRVDELGIGDQVVLPGVVFDLPELMLGADLLVLPSLWEGLPLVLLEAMACGLPVVATRIAGVAGVVEDGVSGLLVEPGDAAALADANL
ncbi:MAG: glycosyltransferase, partial [Candidatus Krumholzibacteriia bacterium]